MEKWLDNNGLADLHRAGFATDRLQRPVELSIDLRVEHALRDELLKAKDKYKAKAASDSSDALFEGTAVSVLLSSNDGLKLLVFDDTNVTTYGIDLVSGALKTGKPKALPGLGGGTPSMEVEAIEPRRVVVTIERLLTSVPAGSGDIVTYPAAD